MKKYIAFISLIITTATPAFAVTTWDSTNCDSTRGVVTTIGGTTFCRSKEKMNQWSAYNWCQAIGGRMATIQELCPGELTDGRGCSIYQTGSSTPIPDTNMIWGINGSGYLRGVGFGKNEKVNYYCAPNTQTN